MHQPHQCFETNDYACIPLGFHRKLSIPHHPENLSEASQNLGEALGSKELLEKKGFTESGDIK